MPNSSVIFQFAALIKDQFLVCVMHTGLMAELDTMS